VIHSDHGTSSSLETENLPSDEHIRERLSNFAAYYLPGNQTIIYDGLTPVNIFRLIFNTYFNSDFEILEDKNYIIMNGFQKDVTILMKDSP